MSSQQIAKNPDYIEAKNNDDDNEGKEKERRDKIPVTTNRVF